MRIHGIHVIGGVLFLCGVCIAVFGATRVVRGHQSRDWPRVVGTIQQSTIESGRRRVKRDRKRSEYRTYYTPNVVYTYEVDGIPRSATTIRAINATSPSESHVADVVNRYPEGSNVDVYYSPEDPDVAMLEPGVESGGIALTVFGLVFAAAALGFMKVAAIAIRASARWQTGSRAIEPINSA